MEAAGVDGVLIETGTALGGSAITMAAAKSTARPMRLYDVFGMIPPPSETRRQRRPRPVRRDRRRPVQGHRGEPYYGYRDDGRRSAEGGGLAAIGRDGLGGALVVDQVQYVDPLAELAGLRVPEPHPVPDGQRVRGRAAQRRLDLAGAFGADQLESGRIDRSRHPVGAGRDRTPASHRRPP